MPMNCGTAPIKQSLDLCSVFYSHALHVQCMWVATAFTCFWNK